MNSRAIPPESPMPSESPMPTGLAPGFACWSPTEGLWRGPVLLAGIVFAALLLLADRLLADPDTQWHIAVGARIWQDGSVPWTDRHSHTFVGAPWIAKEWLSQLVLHGAHRTAGWAGPVIVTAATLSACFAVLFGWLQARLRGTLALALVLIAMMLIAPHCLARPHVFALATLLAWTIGLIGAAERGEAPPLRLLLVQVLWVNLHGSATLAYPLIGLMALDAVLAAPRADRVALGARWAWFGVLALLAGCVTPYGFHALLITATVFGSGESLPFLIEWQPLAFDGIGIMAIGVAALMAAALATDLRRNGVRLLGLAALAAMMLKHSRFLDVFALVAPILVAGPLVRRWPGVGPEGSERNGLAPRADETLASRLPLVVLALVVLALCGAGLATTLRPLPAPAVTPVAALDAAARLGAAGPVYNDYDFGGFLISRGVPTFIDGRTDQLFLGGFISALQRAVGAPEEGPFVDFLARHRVAWALVKPDSRESRHFDRAGWRRPYIDATAAVYIRD